jgi:glyoxylase-like metal-dependent hydrolase (beta-lactamase superfamily II)
VTACSKGPDVGRVGYLGEMATPSAFPQPPIVDWGTAEIRLTPEVSVLGGDAHGAYPSGNTLFVRGAGENILIDPSITVVAHGGAPARIDAVLNSHSHEDHMAGNGLFPNARVHMHDHDLLGARSMDGLMEVYGFEGELREQFSAVVAEEFHYTPRPDAQGFTDGTVFDLGGTKVEAVHLPGHTRGHSGFRISGGVFFLSDIDLTGFGPYYGDAWSNLEDFEASLAKVREEEAQWYVTFHHKGVIEGRNRFLQMVDEFTAVIQRRHDAMLEFLTEPRTIDDMVEHRFIYRPHVEMLFVNLVEKRSSEMHVDRMLRQGEVAVVEPGRYQRI